MGASVASLGLLIAAVGVVPWAASAACLISRNHSEVAIVRRPSSFPPVIVDAIRARVRGNR